MSNIHLERVVSERKKKKISQEEMARRLDINKSSLSRRENGISDFKLSDFLEYLNQLELEMKIMYK